MLSSIVQVDRQVAQLKQQIEALDVRKTELLRRQMFACRVKGCGKKSRLHTVILVQTMWYVEPYSCMGGAYWKHGERQLICPKCFVRHRLIEKSQRPENYYDLCFDKQKEIDNQQYILMERRYGIEHWRSHDIFDNIFEDCDGRHYKPIKLAGKSMPENTSGRSPTVNDIVAMYNIPPEVFCRWINI